MAGSPQRTQTGAAISADGRTIFAATNRGVWAVDTASLAIRATCIAGWDTTSLALSGDGRRLYAQVPSHGASEVLDAPSGHLMGSAGMGAFGSTIEQVAQVKQG